MGFSQSTARSPFEAQQPTMPVQRICQPVTKFVRNDRDQVLELFRGKTSETQNIAKVQSLNNFHLNDEKHSQRAAAISELVHNYKIKQLNELRTFKENNECFATKCLSGVEGKPVYKSLTVAIKSLEAPEEEEDVTSKLLVNSQQRGVNPTMMLIEKIKEAANRNHNLPIFFDKAKDQ